jgi:sortase A
MAKDKRPLEEYSIEELEELLAKKTQEAYEARLHRFQKTGRAIPAEEAQTGLKREDGLESEITSDDQVSKDNRFSFKRILHSAFNRLLLWIEIAVVFGMVYVFFRGFGLLEMLNREVSETIVIPSSSPTALITALVLPSGHTPPTSLGGPAPNDSEIPANLRPLVQSLPVIPAPTSGPEHARQIFINALWSNPQPIVQGDGWEQLKKGVGQHIGSANPGEEGNLVLSAHNDIFGELFRYLDQLETGDEIKIMTASKQFTYIVTGLKIVEPTDVSVMNPTERPTITLISCYPYLIDSQRIVIFGELQEGS